MSIKRNEEIFPECIFEEIFYIVGWKNNKNRNVWKYVRKSCVTDTTQIAGGHLLKLKLMGYKILTYFIAGMFDNFLNVSRNF